MICMLRLRRDMMLWPDGRDKCCTLSFDDGTVEDRRVCEMLRSHNLRATFNINTGLLGHSDELHQSGIDVVHEKLPLQELAEVYDGFELAVHGYSHAHMGEEPPSMAAYEIIRCKAEIESITHTPVRGMAWPISYDGYWMGDAKKLAKACGICYARTTRRSYDCVGVPSDFLAWDAACSFVEDEMEPIVTKFLKPRPVGCTKPYLLYVWGHGYEATGRDAWNRLEWLFDQVSFKPDVWYASNIEVFDYVQAYRNLVYSATGDYIFNPGRMDVWLLVDDKPVCIPSARTVEIGAWER